MSDSCGPLDCSLLGSSVHGISQARILEWIAISFSWGSILPRDQTHVSCIGRQVLNHWVTKADPIHDPEPYLFKSSFPHFLLFSNFILSGWPPSLSLSLPLSHCLNPNITEIQGLCCQSLSFVFGELGSGRNSKSKDKIIHHGWKNTNKAENTHRKIVVLW